MLHRKILSRIPISSSANYLFLKSTKHIMNTLCYNILHILTQEYYYYANYRSVGFYPETGYVVPIVSGS